MRPLTAEEATELRRRASARTVPARMVERAKRIWLLHERERVPAVAKRLGLSADVVRGWLKRFNAEGLDGLKDRLRAGRPFASWTLDRLAAYLHEQCGIPIKRTRLDELLVAEGLRWRTQQTWFGERVDPALANNRGASSALTPSRLQTVR